jgi:serine/threonine protein kinase
MNARTPDTAARRYRIERYLTEGGMGAIYLGKKLGSGGFEKEVVLKQLLPEYTARPEFRDLFFREARISATLDHANIVHTFDLVESDQSLFIVMEYVRGADLRTIVRRARQRQRELSPAAAVHIALGILAGLAYAHTRRDANGTSLDIIHRDVSPSNIICSAYGEAKLSDFGIARAATHSSVFYRVRGKVGYMSPEQARNEPIDHRCDLFSLAVCLYESLSGERLFVGDLTTPADEIYGRAVPPLSQRRPGIPATLDAALERALSPQLEHRYATAAEFSDTLRTVAHHAGLTFSAPELSAHLRDILGDDSSRWLRDEPPAGPPIESQRVPAAIVGLVGKEAASIGIVRGASQGEATPAVLNNTVVSGRKTFDIDSMLNDEATRPGGQPPGGAPVTPRAEELPPSETTRRAVVPVAPGRPSHTPPPVWTRDSGPVRVPVAVAPRDANPPSKSLSGATSSHASPRPTLPPPPAPPFPKRPLSRASQRHAAVPPPFAPFAPLAPSAPSAPAAQFAPAAPVASLGSASSSPVPARGGGRLPPAIPLPPPLPPHHPSTLSTEEVSVEVSGEFEEATPFPGGQVALDAPGLETGDTTLPHASGPARFFTGEAANAMEPGQQQISPAFDEELTRSFVPRAGSPGLPPPGLQADSMHVPSPVRSPEPPPLVEPPTPGILIGASPASTRDRRTGPPRWLAVGALLASALGGAYLASRMTARDADGVVALSAARAGITARSSAGAGPVDDSTGTEPTAPVAIQALTSPPDVPEAAAAAGGAGESQVAAPSSEETATTSSARQRGPSSHRKHRGRH